MVEFEQPVAGRYVRFYFTELNSEAYGDGIGINEITVEGRKINETAAVTGVPALNQIEVAKGTTAEEIRDQLPATVTVKVTVDGVTEPVDVVLPVQWDLSAYSGEKDATYTLQGTLVTQGTIAEAAELPAEVTVKVGTGEEVVVNKETLRTVLEALEEKDLSGYTEESVAALQAALQTAEAVLADESADQAAVDQALAALQAAKEGLKVKDNSGKDDSGKDDPGKNDPGKNDPDKNDPGKNDPGKLIRDQISRLQMFRPMEQPEMMLRLPVREMQDRKYSSEDRRQQFRCVCGIDASESCNGLCRNLSEEKREKQIKQQKI